MFDLLIADADVIDGTGAPRWRADVAVAGGRIAAVGQLQGQAARQQVAAAGLVLAPGFIDTHTHDDRLLLEPPSDGAHPKLSQGVTTVVTGNCGISLAPLVHPSAPPPPLDILGTGGGSPFCFPSFSAYLARLQAGGPALNAACLVGHNTLRVRHVADLSRPASPAEAQAMRADVEEAMQAGAFGLSTGVYYPPARAATLEELVAVGQGVRQGPHPPGLIAMHIRDEGDAIDAAIDEALEVGRQLDVPLVLSHHKLVGARNHGRSVATLARLGLAAQQQRVCIDCYPYNASSTMLLPARVAQSRRVLVTWSQTLPQAAGRWLDELAAEQGTSATDMAQRLLPAGAIYFAMSEDDVERILAHPLTMVGSDGLAHDANPHPRLWGSFPRVLGHYGRERGLFSLETAVHKMTGLPARRFGMTDRGLVKVGAWADLVLFNPSTVRDKATFAQPVQPAEGIEAVWVNGQLAWRDGQVREAHAGQVLRGPQHTA
jgi:N-acyl-D-amino-acid deacylase